MKFLIVTKYFILALFPILLFLATALEAHGQITETLVVGRPIERELKGGEVHKYALTLAAGQFLNIVADQRGIDVVLILTGPDGKQMGQVDSPNGAEGPEPFWFVTKISGQYTVEIGSLETGAKPGKYEIRIAEFRPAVDTDKYLVAGLEAMEIAKSIADQTSPESTNLAVEKYKLAIENFGLAGDRLSQAQANEGLARLYQFLPNFELALRYNLEALSIFETVGDRKESVVIMTRIGSIDEDNGRYAEAIEYFEKALAIARSENDKQAVVKIQNGLGLVRSDLGDSDAALSLYLDALKLAQEIDYRPAILNIYNNIGVLYTDWGDYARGLEYQQKQIEMGKKWFPGKPAPWALLNIGKIHSDQGNFDLGLKYAQEALPLFEASGNKEEISHALNNIGNAYMALGDYDKALDFLKRSNEISIQIGGDDPVALCNIGLIYQYRKDFKTAHEYFAKARNITKDNYAPADLGDAEAYAIEGDHAKSLAAAIHCIDVARRMRAQKDLFMGLTAAGSASRRLGKRKEAWQYFIEAKATIEALRSQAVGGVEQQTAYFEQYLQPYYSMIEMDVEEGKLDEARILVEQARSRTLLDSLQNGPKGSRTSMTESEILSEKSIRTKLLSLNAQIEKNQALTGQSSNLVAELERQLNTARLEFEDFQTRMFALHPDLRVQRGEMTPISLQETTDLLPDEKVAIAEFAVAEDKTFLFVITKDAAKKVSPKVFAVDIKNEELAKRIDAYRAKLANGGLDFQDASRELYDLLLKPAAAQLAGKTNLLIVPDGPLWDLPFQALQDSKGRYLVEQAAVSYAPSLTALKEMAKKAKARKPDGDLELVAFGNPIVGKETSARIKQVFMGEKLDPLPESERLVNELGKMYGANRSKVYVGSQAREETAKSEAPKYRIVQFATHGILNNISPMYSHLVLSQDEKNRNEDGLLEAWEMKDLDLKADMVVLSACDTARGRISNGEGVIGMSWALFIAGTPTTVTSQWKIESSSTTELMLEFHRQLLIGKVSKAEALRRAELKLMKMPQYKHPSYWAGFVMVGDGS